MTAPQAAVGPGDLPWLLLRLAGRVPDDGLALMRALFADADVAETVSMLALALQTGRLALTGDEAPVAREVLRRNGADPGLADSAPRLEL